MVEYNPRGELPKMKDMTEEENYKLKVVLNTLFSMITKGSALSDIQRYAARAASQLDWSTMRANPLEMNTGDEEE